MSELKLCRICLIKGTKLYKLNQFNLKFFYEQITLCKVQSKDDLPHYFCYECAALLHKYHKFKHKCEYGQTTLKNLLASGFLTYHVIEDIRNNRTDLHSTLDNISDGCIKRVKTFNVKHKEELEPLEMENVILNPLNDEPLKYEFNDFHDDIKSEEDEATDVKKYDIVKKADLKPFPDLINLNSDVDFDKSSNVLSEANAALTDLGIPMINMQKAESPKYTNLYNLLLESDLDDSNDATFSINDVEKSVKIEKRNKKAKKITKSKKDSQSDMKDSEHRFVGIIREPKGELSKGNWETKLLTDEEAMEQFRKREFDSKYERMEFKCTKCFKGFSKHEMLLRHNKMWHEKGENECRFCHMQFKWKSKLQGHMMNHYYIYKCLRCGLQFYLKNGAVFHDGHHNGVIHKCKHCGEEYTHISTYYTHLRTSHRNAHACKLCGATFVSQAGVVVHMKRKHVIPDNDDTSTDIYCQKCEISFVSQSAYDEHLSQSKLHEEENKDFKRTRRKRREILANATRCMHCHKRFKSKTDLKLHITEEHPGQNKVERVVCEICGAVLSSAYIEIHMNRHTRKKVYPCQTCGKEFLCVTSHNTHQLTHSGEKPHACPICPKRFGLKGHMEVHYKRVHLKEPYPKSVQKPKYTDCPVCHKTFQSRSHMDTHLRRVHLKEPYPKSGPKLCSICCKPFAYASDLDVHFRRVHLKEPYPKRTYNRKNRNRQTTEVPLYASLPK